MRTLSADAALVAFPSLAASALAAFGGQYLLQAAADGSWYASPYVILPAYIPFAGIMTCILYFMFRGLLERPAVATSMGRNMFNAIAVLAIASALLFDPALAVAMAAAAIGSALTLKAIREWPSPGTRPKWRHRIVGRWPRPAESDH